MQEKILRKLFLGFMQIHILHHGKQEPFYGAWMIEELVEHGYDISPGTLYPILKDMTSKELLVKEDKNVGGKIRKYYSTTEMGEEVLEIARKKAKELFLELEEE